MPVSKRRGYLEQKPQIVVPPKTGGFGRMGLEEAITAIEVIGYDG